MDIVLTAIGNVFTLQNMLLMSVAIFLGIIAGALPGFSATMAVALMVPFTFTMDTIPGLVTIGALYNKVENLTVLYRAHTVYFYGGALWRREA